VYSADYVYKLHADCHCSADTVQVKRIVSEVLPVHRTDYDNSPLMLALVEYGEW